MGVTNTTNYNLIKPNIFEELDAWGGHMNTNSDSIDTIMKANEDAAATADSKGDQGISDAAAAQATADTALANAATADGKAVAAQATTDTALANAAAAQATADTADGKADDNAATKAPIDNPDFTTGASLEGNALATEAVADAKDTAAAYPVSELTGADYTPSLADRGKTVRINCDGAPRNYNIPLEATVSLPVGYRQNVWVYGAGTNDLTINPEVGVTTHAYEDKRKLIGKAAGCTVEKTDTNEWIIIGITSP